MEENKDGNKFLDFVESAIEDVIFRSRWLLAPLYLCLIFGLMALLAHTPHMLMNIVHAVMEGNSKKVSIDLLELVDMVLMSNLILIILMSGYTNFVSILNVAEASEDRPVWLDHVDFGTLKLKLIGSIVAISAIALLGDFMEIEKVDKNDLAWKFGLHMLFTFSGLFFAVTEWVMKNGEIMVHKGMPHAGKHDANHKATPEGH
ncbi:MAG: YqhA family protein [Magnetococcus sp. DMHC-1]|nr:YqhA family protein [Magnetococcales bacterium]